MKNREITKKVEGPESTLDDSDFILIGTHPRVHDTKTPFYFSFECGPGQEIC
jgi:hypothetical protein